MLAHLKAISTSYRIFQIPLLNCKFYTKPSIMCEEKSNLPLGLPSVENTTNEQKDTTVKLNDLGPVIINVDGTISRVNNWDAMSDIEKETFNRLILKRNKERLNLLKDKQNLN